MINFRVWFWKHNDMQMENKIELFEVKSLG